MLGSIVDIVEDCRAVGDSEVRAHVNFLEGRGLPPGLRRRLRNLFEV
jgi:hypothetical protein